MARQVSRNYTSPCWALKLDIRKFFDSVDHGVLIGLLREKMADTQLLGLLENIIGSFHTCHAEFSSASKVLKQVQDDRVSGKGMPLGNLTSQLFANIYLDPLDKFAKHYLKAMYYLRYADDFIFLSDNLDELMGYLVEVARFLKSKLKLQLHPNKLILRKLKWGIDYVGYVALPHYNLPRRKTVKLILRQIARRKDAGNEDALAKALSSYLGYLRHVEAHKLTKRITDTIKV